jgi:Fe2+ transport system protein FeoA
MSLAILEEGRAATVTRIRGGHGVRAQLLRLGIVPGVHIKKLHSSTGGSLVLEVLGTSVMLGQGMAAAVELV